MPSISQPPDAVYNTHTYKGQLLTLLQSPRFTYCKTVLSIAISGILVVDFLKQIRDYNVTQIQYVNKDLTDHMLIFRRSRIEAESQSNRICNSRFSYVQQQDFLV